MRTLVTLYYFCFCVNALRLPANTPNYDIAEKKTNGKALDFGPQHWPINGYERGAIAVGKPFAVYVDESDETEELSMRPSEQQLTDPEMFCANGHHFFNEDDCKMFISKEMCDKKRRTKTFLASYPGSGNSWTRQLLENSLGIYTGSVYHDAPLVRAGMKGEGQRDPSKVIAIKTHQADLGPTDQALTIIRDPLHAALSFQTWIITRKHVKEIGQKNLENSFRGHLKERLQEWAQWARFFKDRNDTMVLRYEDLVANPRDMFLKKVYPFLGVNPDDEELVKRTDCAVKVGECGQNCSNPTQRQHSYVFQFTDQHKEVLKQVVEQELLQYYGYTL